MFSDLLDNTAVKLADLYIVKLANGYGTEYELNGVRVRGGTHTVPSLDNIFKVIPSKKVLTHYHLDGDIITPTAYNSKSPHRYYDEDFEEYTFDTLEQEYEFKKEWERVKGAKPVYEETPENLVPVEIEVVGVQVDTESKFIDTPYQLGKAFFDKHSEGIFSINLASVAANEVSKLKAEFPNSTFKNSTHSHLEYLQVNGKYIWGSGSKDSFITGKNSVRVTTTLEQAQALEKDIRSKVRSRILVEVKPITADSMMVKDLYDTLSNIKSCVVNLEVKQKSNYSKNVLYTSLQKKMEELQKFIEEN